MRSATKSRTMRSFPVLIFLIVIIILINGCFFSASYNHAQEVRNSITNQIINDQWEIVREEILNQYKLSSANIKFISKKVECEILRKYAENMDVLKQDFENNTLDEELFEILKQQLQDDSSTANDATTNNSYNYVLGFRDRILSIFSSGSKEDLSSLKTWDEYFNASANVHLNESLVSNIVNKNLSENLLLYQITNLDTKSESITAHDIDALESVFKSGGLAALKNVEFVNVAYITEYGDIFGTHDYMYLEKVPNYKMILVSTSNIYDTIYPSVKVKLNMYNAENELMLKDISEAVSRKCLEFVTTTLSLLALIVVFGGFYNKDIEKSE